MKYYFNLIALSLVIVRNPANNKFLTIRETRSRGWWIPGGKVEPPEDLLNTSIRECKEESGIDIQLKGMLDLIYDYKEQESIKNYMKLKLVLYGEPIDQNQIPKKVPDQHSEEARWVSMDEYATLISKPPYERGHELRTYSKQVMDGNIYPLIMRNAHVVEPFNQ